MWNIDAKRFSVLPPEDAAAAFSSDGQGGPFMVVHPSKGGILPERLSALVHKGLQLAEVGGGVRLGVAAGRAACVVKQDPGKYCCMCAQLPTHPLA